MNEFLSAKAIDLRALVGTGRTVDSIVQLDGGKSLHVSARFDLPHFKVAIDGSEIFVETSSRCELRKIKTGLFKGCYCVIDRLTLKSGRTAVYILGDKFLKLAEEKEILTDAEVDKLLDREYIEKLTAKKLNYFDITHEVQDYKLFCDKLPKQVLADKKFLTNVMKYFFAFGDVKFAQKTNTQFIDKNMCKAVAYKYLDNLSASTKKIEQENGI